MSSTISAKAVVCDVEGTTTSISFVKDTLFPYALKHVESFLKDTWDAETTKELVKTFRQQSKDDIEAKLAGAIAILEEDKEIAEQISAIFQNVKWQMDNDRKAGPLKTLQGLIFANGYKDGTIKGHVYVDVPTAFESWVSAGSKIYIYSSGSIQAQKQLFANTEYGDLLPKLTGHFDTAIGPKQDKDSYIKIVKEIGCDAEEVLFLTDVVNEAKAAKEAGIKVMVLERPGNALLTNEDKLEFNVISSCEDVVIDVNTVTKRKIDDAVNNEDRPTKIPKIETLNDANANNETDAKNEQLKTNTDESIDISKEDISSNINGSSKINDESAMDVDDVDDAKNVVEDLNKKTDVNNSIEKTVENVDNDIQKDVASTESIDVDMKNDTSKSIDESPKENDVVNDKPSELIKNDTPELVLPDRVPENVESKRDISELENKKDDVADDKITAEEQISNDKITLTEEQATIDENIVESVSNVVTKEQHKEKETEGKEKADNLDVTVENGDVILVEDKIKNVEPVINEDKKSDMNADNNAVKDEDNSIATSTIETLNVDSPVVDVTKADLIENQNESVETNKKCRQNENDIEKVLEIEAKTTQSNDNSLKGVSKEKETTNNAILEKSIKDDISSEKSMDVVESNKENGNSEASKETILDEAPIVDNALNATNNLTENGTKETNMDILKQGDKIESTKAETNDNIVLDIDVDMSSENKLKEAAPVDEKVSMENGTVKEESNVDKLPISKEENEILMKDDNIAINNSVSSEKNGPVMDIDITSDGKIEETKPDVDVKMDVTEEKPETISVESTNSTISSGILEVSDKTEHTMKDEQITDTPMLPEKIADNEMETDSVDTKDVAVTDDTKMNTVTDDTKTKSVTDDTKTNPVINDTKTCDTTLCSESPIVPDKPVDTVTEMETDTVKPKSEIIIPITISSNNTETTNCHAGETKIPCETLAANTTHSIPISVENEETNNSSNVTTSEKTEVSEIIETGSQNNKEKISRVEITIEQSEKQAGQTTQTTTHIVKEISITEKMVCGKKECIADVSVSTENGETSSLNGTAVDSKTEKIPTDLKVETEIHANGNEKLSDNKNIDSTNGTEKSENDSDKENDVTENIPTMSTNGDDKESLTDNSILVKKCPEVVNQSAANSVEAES